MTTTLHSETNETEEKEEKKKKTKFEFRWQETNSKGIFFNTDNQLPEWNNVLSWLTITYEKYEIE